MFVADVDEVASTEDAGELVVAVIFVVVVAEDGWLFVGTPTKVCCVTTGSVVVVVEAVGVLEADFPPAFMSRAFN